MTEAILAALAIMFLTAPGLVATILVAGVVGIALWGSGVAYARRQMRENPEQFLANINKLKDVRDDLRQRWAKVSEQVKLKFE